MKLTYKSATSHSCLTLDTKTKTYVIWNGFGSNAIVVKSNKEINALELELVKGGYQKI